jgi:hypothetical protein
VDGKGWHGYGGYGWKIWNSGYIFVCMDYGVVELGMALDLGWYIKLGGVYSLYIGRHIGVFTLIAW